ncbi:hypothetical protein Tco_1535740, partial [Tanacetum coccineum]
MLTEKDIFNVKLTTGSQTSEDVRSCPMPDTLITDEIKISEAYKIFISLSKGLIPPKIGRGKGAQGTKATVASKKKLAKKNDVYKKKSIDYSQKLKGIKLLSDIAQLEIDTKKAIKASKHKIRFQHQSGGSSEGVGITPEVPDVPTGKSIVSDEGTGISPEVSTNEDEEDDKCIDIENTNDERTESDNDDYALTDAVKIDADKEQEENSKKVKEQKADEELKADEEKQGDDQAGDEQVGGFVLAAHKEKPNLLQSTSSHSVSSNFGNQFLNNSPNVSLIGTIQEKVKAEINSLLDIQIQQEVPSIQQEPFHQVKVSVIPEPTQIPPSTPTTPPLSATEVPVT